MPGDRWRVDTVGAGREPPLVRPPTHRLVLWFHLGALFSLACCAGYGAGTRSTIPFRRLQPGAHAGGLYLYRAPDSATYWTHYFISFDGRMVGELRAGAYLYIQAGPGKHRLEVREMSPSRYARKKGIEPGYDVELRAGHSVIVRFPVLSEGILLRFGVGYEEELSGMKEGSVLFLRPKPED